jgi:hypothetical protein
MCKPSLNITTRGRTQCIRQFIQQSTERASLGRAQDRLDFRPAQLDRIRVGADLIAGDWLDAARVPGRAWRQALLAASWTVILSLVLVRFAGGGSALPFIYGQF